MERKEYLKLRLAYVLNSINYQLVDIMYGLNVFVLPQIHMLKSLPPTPKVMVLEGVAFEKWLGHENRVILDGISTLTKEASESLFALSAMWGYNEKSAT